MNGTVERLDRSTGRGAIFAEDGREFFFEMASLHGIAVEDIKLGMRVQFQPRSEDTTLDPVIIFGAEEVPTPTSIADAIQAPAVPADQVKPPDVEHGDDVAEASWESFPASDPPAHSGIT